MTCEYCDEPALGGELCDSCAWLREAAVAYALTWPWQTVDAASDFATWYLREYAEDFQAHRAPDFGPQFRAWAERNGTPR